MLFDLETARVPEGTVLLIGAQYRNSETGELHPKIWTYAALKVGGRWYLTGTGKVPQDAGWGAVKRWLASHGREVVWIKMATELETLYAADTSEGPEDTARDGVPGGTLGSLPDVRNNCAFCGRERSQKDDNHGPECPYWTIGPGSFA